MTGLDYDTRAFNSNAADLQIKAYLSMMMFAFVRALKLFQVSGSLFSMLFVRSPFDIAKDAFLDWALRNVYCLLYFTARYF